jgi:AmmeMemoRadiSam system protein A
MSPTTEADRARLLRLAREALRACVCRLPMPALDDSEILARLGGAFVTLHLSGQLRGCIGHVEADEPLGLVVSRCAVAAATSDPRFQAVAESELPEIEIELSLLGPLEEVPGGEAIEIGRHGLVIERGRRRGLLLPQVAAEHSWDRVRFLAETCRKAGLPPDAWDKGATVWRFEAEVFGEP